MAKKFFNKKIKQKSKIQTKRKTVITVLIILACIIGIVICFIITTSLTSNLPSNAKVELQDSVNVELYGKLPEDDVFFKVLEGIDENEINIDYSNVDLEKVGTYKVPIEIYGEKYEGKIKVVDLVKPELVVKNVSINSGDEFDANSFVESCSDNSKDDCIIKFFEDAVDQDGNKVNYSSYTDNGSYEVKIVAEDASGNETVLPATLTIGEGSTAAACNYGNLEYDQSIVIANIVGSNGCALDLNLYQEIHIVKPVSDMAISETDKLKSQLDSIQGLTSNITINRVINPVLNNTGDGLVGYSLYMEANDENGEAIVTYYLKTDGSRVYEINVHNLN